MKLSERAMLSTLHRGMWSGSKHDQQVTEDTAEAHKVDTKEAGRYSKQLISRKFLSKVASKMTVARQTHRILTLPWDDEGTRILSAQGYLHYTQVMRTCRLGVESAAGEFLKNYPDHIRVAKTLLGNMFNSEDYPSAEELKKKFYLDVEIKPIPEAGDFRTKLANNTVKAIADDIERRTNERIEAAVKDVFQRIVDVTGKMAERLGSYEPSQGEGKASGLFRDSLIYNVKELADLLPSLNIVDDPRLDGLAKQLNADLVQHSPEILRTDAKIRKQTALKADKIFKKVSTYLA
jgi:hypothetical protein